jgi:hypothetical protein
MQGLDYDEYWGVCNFHGDFSGLMCMECKKKQTINLDLTLLFIEQQGAISGKFSTKNAGNLQRSAKRTKKRRD